MSEETEIGTQTLDSSSDTIKLRLRQETELEPNLNETSTDELTLKSIDERIKQVTDPILRIVEELCVLLASRTRWNPLATEKRPVRGAIASPLAPHVTGTTKRRCKFSFDGTQIISVYTSTHS